MPTLSSSDSAVATRPAIRPTSAAAASWSALAAPSWPSVGLGGGGAASAGAAVPESTTAARTPTNSARNGRPAAGRREPGRRGGAGPDGRRSDMCSLPGEEGGAMVGGTPEESQRPRESQRQHAAQLPQQTEFVK